MPTPTAPARPATDEEFLADFLPRLTRPAEELDAHPDPAALLEAVADLGRRAVGDPDAFFTQQYLLSRIYGLHTQLPTGPTAETSTVLHAVTRRLEQDTADAEDSWIDPALYEGMPDDPAAFVAWLKGVAREHPVFKHPYYHRFLRNEATPDDLRRFVLQESSVDSRFDDLLAAMQIGTDGVTKMEIAKNFWDEMGNGNPAEVHTVLFDRIIRHFGITDEELSEHLSAEALLGGNLAVLICRYRGLFAEAVGHLAIAEWLAPDRFSQVLHAWQRLDLPPDGITYHKLHIGIDAHHASAWFAHVVKPMAVSPEARRAITRGALWRLNSSGRYLDRILNLV
ncbi:iron-containing redox enzyme family protein [Kitasatospora cineracea]|uniref:iron-containing redox enzyme family protein n=1 Tax=Kitasatospora cineracea TaxID=88074 RepID=UPI00343FABD9